MFISLLEINRTLFLTSLHSEQTSAQSSVLSENHHNDSLNYGEWQFPGGPCRGGSEACTLCPRWSPLEQRATGLNTLVLPSENAQAGLKLKEASLESHPHSAFCPSSLSGVFDIGFPQAQPSTWILIPYFRHNSQLASDATQAFFTSDFPHPYSVPASTLFCHLSGQALQASSVLTFSTTHGLWHKRTKL